MNNKKQLVILIIAGMMLFLLGGVLGVVYQKWSQHVKVGAVNSLSSKAVSSIVAYGQVENIDGRNITLGNLGDNLAITIANNAQVYSFAISSGAAAPVQQIVQFENIKVGDNINVAIKLLPTGQFEGSSVIILPLPAK